MGKYILEFAVGFFVISYDVDAGCEFRYLRKQ